MTSFQSQRPSIAWMEYIIRMTLAEAIKAETDALYLREEWYGEEFHERSYLLIDELRKNHKVPLTMYRQGRLDEWIIKLGQSLRLTPDEIDIMVSNITFNDR